ncbi:hypothetical protein SSTU70S_06703 [Stutzerimonas stutzeri]
MVAGSWREAVTPTPTLLFRYSAVTFNGHRIHYDWPYVTETEGYAGLVVHGPLIATLNLRAFCRANPDARLRRFAYRGGVRPADRAAAVRGRRAHRRAGPGRTLGRRPQRPGAESRSGIRLNRRVDNGAALSTVEATCRTSEKPR